MYVNQKKAVLCLVIACGGLVSTMFRVLHAPDSLDNTVKSGASVPAEEHSLLVDAANSIRSSSSNTVPKNKSAFLELEPAPSILTSADHLPQTRDQAVDEVVVEQQNGYEIKYRKREIMLKFARGMNHDEINRLLDRHNLELVESDGKLAKIGYTKVRIPEDHDLREALSLLHEDDPDLITKAEPNFIMGTLGASDPLHSDQWYVQAAAFDQAWKVLESTNAVIVAVVDTGVESGHPDLIGKCLAGYNVVSDNAATLDDHGHGTFVSGIIAASWNDEGIRGLCPNARILPVKALDASGSGSYEDVAKAIIYAADQGAKVINLSVGGYAYSYVLQDAIDYALERGSVLVASGGNDGLDQKIYPAAYPSVLGVGSTGAGGAVLPSSNTGGHIDCVAPGGNVLSTGLDGQYVSTSGSSASAAMVSSLAALLMPEKDTLSAASLRRSILESAKDLGDAGPDPSYGFGLIDSYAAAEWCEDAFHDVAITRISFDSMSVRQTRQAYVNVTLRNLGTYQKELCQVLLYEGKGDARRQIASKNHVPVRDSKEIHFEWDVAGLQTDMRVLISAEVILEDDACPENNVKSAKKVSVVKRDDMIVLHQIAPPVHQWIAGEAYQIAKAVLSAEAQSEMDAYIPAKTQITVEGHQVQGYSEAYQVIKGSKEEDEVGILPYFNHFWNQDGGPDGGIPFFGSETAYQRAERFWSSALADYEAGNKASAYYTLGRIVHLITDMSVPAHVHNDEHLGGWDHDSFEAYMGEYNDDLNNAYNYHQWTASGSAISKTSLFGFFNDLADTTDDYDSNDASGELAGHSEGHNGAWETQDGWFGTWDISYAETKNHGNILVPLAMRYVAGLYAYFWDETHPNPDADGDGVPDWWEIQYFAAGTNMQPNAHGDTDGFNNLNEYIAGTDPTNAFSYFMASNSIAGGTETNFFVVEWESVSNRLYDVLWETNLANTFLALETDIEFPQDSYTDTVHSAENKGFYRVKVRLK